MNSYYSQAMNLAEPECHTGVMPFQQTLLNHNINLEKGITRTLQINIGLTCNQSCVHCHLNAGPLRKEIMPWEVMQQVADFADSNNFETIDITGGAPEIHPRLEGFLSLLSKSNKTITLRSNLSALYQEGGRIAKELKKYKVNIIASFPSLNELQTEAIRGKGIFDSSITALKKLNTLGYGNSESNLGLDLVVNPSGAFLSPSQDSLEKRFKKTLENKWGIQFSRLYSFANIPLGRFRSWLQNSGNFNPYMEKLESSFNPEAMGGLMCKTLLSVSWDGYLYDCDFNQAANLPMGDKKTHISEIKKPPEPGSRIAVGDHCYTCTAGSGFT